MKIQTIDEAIKEIEDWGGYEAAIDLIDNNQDAVKMLTVAMQSVKEALEWLTPIDNEKIRKTDIDEAVKRLSSLQEQLPNSTVISNMFFYFDMANTLFMAIGVHLRDQEKENSNKNYAQSQGK